MSILAVRTSSTDDSVQRYRNNHQCLGFTSLHAIDVYHPRLYDRSKILAEFTFLYGGHESRLPSNRGLLRFQLMAVSHGFCMQGR